MSGSTSVRHWLHGHERGRSGHIRARIPPPDKKPAKKIVPERLTAAYGSRGRCIGEGQRIEMVVAKRMIVQLWVAVQIRSCPLVAATGEQESRGMFSTIYLCHQMPLFLYSCGVFRSLASVCRPERQRQEKLSSVVQLHSNTNNLIAWHCNS